MMPLNNQAIEELTSILDVSFDGITIANGEGIFIRVSKSCEELFGVKISEILGESSLYLEDKKIFDKSVTSEVLKRKDRVTLVQKTSADKIVLVTGIPIFDKDKNIEKVINISKDITETKKLKSDLKNLQTELDWFKQELSKRNGIDNQKITYKSAAMKQIIDTVHHVVNFDATVLLLGETGVGKGFMAKMIHSLSKRRDLPFVNINCGAIPEHLLESELFGYEKGAFTGASKEGKRGLFEIADEGIIFLDEIGELPLSLQVKLLHVLDDKRVRRIGGTTSYEVKARVIAATNKNLKEVVKQGRFREDLFYRLNVIPINIPALRERKEDLPFLINMFLENINDKYGTEKYFSENAIKLLLEYDFPGNIRELQNMIERLVIITIGDKIGSNKIHYLIEPLSISLSNKLGPLKETVEAVERNLLIAAFIEYKTTRKVAEVLQIDQSTVVKKAKKFKIPLK
ncbi:sigma-54 interaction domain-containing protein [Peribacillus sp. NPDC096540]|uniref:sigma-54 interaction domain-containing protein n=1 Tax=Peribacillus sp. NPDC096540 TaxID=3390612 RepID=UPI003CFF2457